jgi:hypothetical protein
MKDFFDRKCHLGSPLAEPDECWGCGRRDRTCESIAIQRDFRSLALDFEAIPKAIPLCGACAARYAARYASLFVSQKQKAYRHLRRARGAFIAGFTKSCPAAMKLELKPPIVIWKRAGIPNFVYIRELVGPASYHGGPLLFRLNANIDVPVALCYLGKKWWRKRGFSDGPDSFRNNDVIELSALPEEIGEFGPWLWSWFEALRRRDATPPTPPVALLSATIGDDLVERLHDFTALGQDWPDHTYLWTPRAMRKWRAWLKTSS